MLRRDLQRALRMPGITIAGILMPIVMLLLFVKVFGGAMSAGLGGGSYIDYVAPAIIIMAVCSGSGFTAINVSNDMTNGIIARFRTMAIFRPSVLVGTVIGSTIRTLVSVGLVIGVSILLGFRPVAGILDWATAIVVIGLLTFAVQWLAVAIGLVTKSVAGANSATFPLQFGAFISSAFVDPASMSPGLAWFAKNQPFTPIIDSIRGLLMGTSIGDSGVIAIVWCIAIALTGYVWAISVYNRAPTAW
jgi:ABC-2 type transport system permease protein